jgi:hypothetical protein
MSLRRQLTHGLRTLLRPTARDRDLDEELRQFYDETSRPQPNCPPLNQQAPSRTRMPHSHVSLPHSRA